ncbi:MAG TPA: NAD(P)H-binding protein [Gemmatimonadales bacterium]|nr:NAD(P)H-binding protein [Gemmatimonadales bacterium]
MRIFIAGGTGVIGRRVVPLLLAGGHRVTVATRKNGRQPNWSGDVAARAVDLFDPATLAPALSGQDAVINLATHMPPSTMRMLFRREWLENDRIRREGSRNLVQAALESDVHRLVQESFAPAYPDRGDEWIDESVPLAPGAYNPDHPRRRGLGPALQRGGASRRGSAVRRLLRPRLIPAERLPQGATVGLGAPAGRSARVPLVGVAR